MATWRQMTPSDIDGLLIVADQVHPDLPEKAEVFIERAELFPEGCMVLVDPKNDKVCGYLVSHPILKNQPPALDSLLGRIAPNSDQYYIHDVAVLPSHRGRGVASIGIKKVLEVARRYPSSCLVSVYGTSKFWAQFGFEPSQVDEVFEDKIRESYGDDAVYLVRGNEGTAVTMCQ